MTYLGEVRAPRIVHLHKVVVLHEQATLNARVDSRAVHIFVQVVVEVATAA